MIAREITTDHRTAKMANINTMPLEILENILKQLYKMEPRYNESLVKLMKQHSYGKAMHFVAWKENAVCEEANFGLTLVVCRRINSHWRHRVDDLFGNFFLKEKEVILMCRHTFNWGRTLYPHISAHSDMIKFRDIAAKKWELTMSLSRFQPSARWMAWSRLVSAMVKIGLDFEGVKEMVEVGLLDLNMPV